MKKVSYLFLNQYRNNLFMKNSFLLVFLFINTITFSQDHYFSGIIKDFSTKEPIEKVSISIEGTNQGTLSNEEGKFRINISAENFKIILSHISYDAIQYETKNNSNDVEIFLHQKEFVLEDVVINGKPGKTLLTDAVAASKEKLEKSLLLNTYYREFIKVDGKYTSFSDGILDYYIKRKSGASDLYVKQSRVLDLKDANASEREKAILSVSFNDVKEAVKYAYNFKFVSEILKSDNYNFPVETKKEANGNSIDIVTIEPKEGIEEEMIYTGSVTYDSKTKLILDVDLRFSPEHKKYAQVHNILIAKVKFNDFVRKSSFRIDGDKYVMVYSQNKINAYVKFGKMINNTFESLSDVTTLDYKEGEFNLDKTKKYKEKTLFANGNKYVDEFWKKYNVVLLSNAEENIIKTLNEK